MNLFRNQPRILWLSLLINTVFLLLKIFLSLPTLRIFISLLLWLFLPFLFIPLLIYFFVFFWSFWYFVKFEKPRSALPLCINLIFVSVIIFIPFYQIYIQVKFQTEFKDMEQVVRFKYQHLSLAEKVRQEDENLFFFVNKEGGFHGDTYQGFVYQNNLENPQQCPGVRSTGEHDQQTFKKLQDHWFWGECYVDD